jgi:hypothetical protein
MRKRLDNQEWKENNTAVMNFNHASMSDSRAQSG